VTLVGIIANPASGKDIRRLVGHARVVSNHEKVSIVRRLLVGISSMGVDQVLIMPDQFGIGARALRGLRDHSSALDRTSMLSMEVLGGPADTERAAAQLREQSAGCIVVLGGDGTCRAAAKECGDVPLLPISTGTNNVVPTFVEGTVAGLAAGYVAHQDRAILPVICTRHKRLLVRVADEQVDQALVEVAAIAARFVGSRAVWDQERVRQVFATRASPAAIGLSAILGALHPVTPAAPCGALARLGPSEERVRVVMAPGRVELVGVCSTAKLRPGEWYGLTGERPLVLALDGEREIVLAEGQEAAVKLELEGPWIVDVQRALQHAVTEGAFAA
jgi:predicted polyphosphate/ATP-dependent NAD kinase